MPEEQPQSAFEAEQFVEFPFPTIYTNAISVGSTFLDFSLLIIERFDLKNSTVRSRIVMTPAHAKMLFIALGSQMEKYEARFGEIKIPTAAIPSSEPLPQP